MARNGLLIAIFACATTVFAPSARAEVPSSFHVIGGRKGCPSATDVASALGRRFPGVPVGVGAEFPGAPVGIFDLGDSYLVMVNGTDKTYTDPLRRCGERARTVALFVKLEFVPPISDDVLLLEGEPEETEGGGGVDTPGWLANAAAALSGGERLELALFTSPAVTTVVVTREPTIGAALDVEVGGVVEGAPAASLLSGGAVLRIAISRQRTRGALDHFALVLGAGGLSPGSMALQSGQMGRAQLIRAPLEIDVRGLLTSPGEPGVARVLVAAEIGLSATVLSAKGLNLNVPAERSTSVVLGLRGALLLQARLANDRLIPFLLVDCVWNPSPPDLTTRALQNDSAPPAATVPGLWVGGAAGLAFRVL